MIECYDEYLYTEVTIIFCAIMWIVPMVGLLIGAAVEKLIEVFKNEDT